MRCSTFSSLVVIIFSVVVASFAQQTFQDVASDVGLAQIGVCGAMFWYDVDDDGDQDFLRTSRFDTDTELYLNDNGMFYAQSQIGLPENRDAGTCVPMDFDHDGDLDILIDCWGDNQVLLRNSAGSYTNVWSSMGLPPRSHGRCIDWVDYNHDGWMDILSQTSSGWHLYQNNGGSGFAEVTSEANLPDDDGAGFCLADIDLDGDVDMFTTQISGTGKLWVNLGQGVFADMTISSGLSGIPASAGCAWVDFNHDKFPDLITQWFGRHGIWKNEGDGTFFAMNVHGMETDFSDWPHGARYYSADYDRDGDHDVYCVRSGGCGSSPAANQLFRQEAQSATEIWFTDVAPEFGMNVMADGFGGWVDYEGDGDLDFCLISHNDPIRLYRNNATAASSYLEVKVLGPNGENDCWHTRLELYEHGSSEVLRTAEISYINGDRNGLKAYFAAQSESAYDLRLTFPSGVVMTPVEFPGLSGIVPIEVNHLVTVHMGVGALSARDAPATPQQFGIMRVYPNPFNCITNISLSVTHPGVVAVRIFDLNGRLMEQLLDSDLTAGEHSVNWNASKFASGIYLAEARQGDERTAQKIVLLK